MDYAVEAFTLTKSLNAVSQVEEIKTYIYERLRGYYQEQGIRHDVFEAVMIVKPRKLSDFTARINALSDFLGDTSAGNLFAANKRISNILKTTDTVGQVDKNFFAEAQETALFKAGQGVKESLGKAVKNGDYPAALRALAMLRQPLDDFFDHVMVMTDDKALKNNRLALLVEIRGLFMQVADFSVIDASV